MYPFLRFVKVLAVAMLFVGSVGAVMPRSYDDRRRYAYWLAGPGFGLTWIAGYLLTLELSVSLLSTWIILAMVLSLFSLQVVLFTAGRETRRSGTLAALILVPLVATVALMIWRPRW